MNYPHKEFDYNKNPMLPPDQRPDSGLRSFSMFIYIISSMCAFLQLGNSMGMIIISFIFLFLVWMMNRAQKMAAKDTIYYSHVEWVRRTSAIGGFFVFPACYILGMWLIWKDTDVNSVLSAMHNADDPDAVMGATQSYIAKNAGKVDYISTWCVLPAVIWWVRRCYVGFMRARNGLPIDYPESLI